MNEDAVWYALAKAVGETLGMPDLHERVTFEWSSRMSRTIANARPHRMLIKVNQDAWPFLNEDERDKVIVHELCHIVVGQAYPREGHGYRWKNAMRQCGYNPDRCTKMPAEYRTAVAHKRRTVAKFTVYCNCGEHHVTRKVYQTYQMRRCTRCKSKLRLTKEKTLV
jgi:predicted SprT family Zn-dependent metalloprotease